MVRVSEEMEMLRTESRVFVCIFPNTTQVF